MAFAHDDVVHAGFEALVVLDKGEHEVFLFFGVDEVGVGRVVPGNGFNVINVEVYFRYRVSSYFTD